MKIIFVGGCPRSGTTALAAMLGNSKETVAIPECPFKFYLMTGLNGSCSEEDVLDILDKTVRHYSFRSWNIDLEPAGFISKLDFSRPLFMQVYFGIIRIYLKKHWPEKETHVNWVIDHDPSNCKYATSLSAGLPDASYIHIVRDGRAISASVIPLDWGPNDIYSSSLFWLSNLAFGFAAENVFHRTIRVRYEDILCSPDQQVSLICDTLKILYSPEMLVPKGLKLPRYTNHQHQLIGEKLRPDRINAWMRALTDIEIGAFQKETYEILLMLGYELVPVSGRATAMMKLRLKIFGMVRNYSNHLKKGKRERSAGDF